MAGPLARVAEGAEALVVAVDAVRALGAWAGILVAALGVAALATATRFRRPLAVLGGAAIGALAAVALRGRLAAHLGLSLAPAALYAAALGGAACGFRPSAFPVAAGALPGALLGVSVPLAGSALLGAGAGAALGGVVGAAFARVVGAGFAAAVGGALAAIGLAAALHGHALAREIAARPFALAAIALVLAIAGAAFQLSRPDAAPARDAPLRPPDRF